MVEMALTRLTEDGVVALDEERTASMASNLMLVLCAEPPPSPVVNAGSPPSETSAASRIAAKLTAYLGLDPRVRQSGAGPATHGHISKHGSTSARHALVEACWMRVRQPGPIAGFCPRIKARRGHSIAIVA
jgi:hypothetical protein